MSTVDKVVLINKIEETLKPRMFANLFDEASDEIKETLTEFDVNRISSKSEDIDNCLELFINAKTAEGKSEKTILRYSYIISRFLKTISVPAKNVTPQIIRTYLESEIDRGINPNTVKGTREVLSSFYNWLYLERLIQINPMTNIAPITVPNKVRKPYKAVDIENLKRSCSSIKQLAVICILNSTACRVGEISKLNIQDVNLQTGEAIVFGKGRKERYVYLDDITLMLLKEYLATRTDSNPALFINKQKERLKPDGIRKILNVVAEKANIENVHPHRFRRTMITKLLNRGMPIQDVTILAGHSKLDTTMKYYTADNQNIKFEYQKYAL